MKRDRFKSHIELPKRMGDQIFIDPTERIQFAHALEHLLRVGAGDSSEPKDRFYLLCSLSKYEGPLSLDVQLRFQPHHVPPLYIQIKSVVQTFLPIGLDPHRCAHEYDRQIFCQNAADAIEKFEAWTAQLPGDREDQYNAARHVCEEQLMTRYKRDIE